MARTGAGAPPGSNSRGRGGKFRKFTRGGGKHYSRDLRPQDENGNEISMWSEDAQRQLASLSDETNSEEDSEDGSDDEVSGQAVSREERKKEKKLRKEAAIARKNAQPVEVGDLPPSDDDEDDDEDMPNNPNHSKQARNQTRLVDDITGGVDKLSVSNRKERESAEAQAAKEKYRALHEQGKTDEAKADLARLKVIREQREAEAARRKAEKEERDAQEAARKAELEAKLASIEAKKSGKKLK
ncbi:hypothetical protein jhhlp_005709 [Lomentospora prolificans]|uniref:Casein kinase substrate phosphoprotein PP28 domain-containing protein n=1 Tax=Lomentospora prolificans TaxID=41688 RepID=A0A2N3N3V2_9PEZI|nr:hypothetical protein jhhlp_005709 [Lomentospora prolificans]